MFVTTRSAFFLCGAPMRRGTRLAGAAVAVAGVGWLPALGMGCLASVLWPIILVLFLLPLLGNFVP